jgi:hypothetical protein
MWDWFHQARDKAIPLSGPILQSKALEFTSQLDIADMVSENFLTFCLEVLVQRDDV